MTKETMSDAQVKVLKETLYYCLNKLKSVDLILSDHREDYPESISKHVFEMIQELRKLI